jgi:hypothetical protein
VCFCVSDGIFGGPGDGGGESVHSRDYLYDLKSRA